MSDKFDCLQPVYVLKDEFDKGGESLLISAETFAAELIKRAPIDLSEISDTVNMSVLVDVFRYTSLDDGIENFLSTLFPFEPAMAIARRGLVEMHATEFLAVFDKAHAIVTDMGEVNHYKFRRGRYEVPEETQNLFKELHNQLSTLEAKRSLVDFNADWLTQHPDLRVLSATEWDKKLDELTAEVKKIQQQRSEFTDKQTRAEKIALALSKMARLDFKNITTMEPRLEVAGESVIGFNFVTEQGAYFFYEVDAQARLHEQGTMNLICVLELGDKFSG